MVVGSEYCPNDGHILTIEDFDNLKEDEQFFLVDPNVCDGDYVFRLTPELMMDFDIRENPIVIDTYRNLQLYKVRKFASDEWDTDMVYDAKYWGRYGVPGEKMDIHDVKRKNGEQVMCWTVDDHTPRERRDILDWLGEKLCDNED
jgi:hypothetical protein